MKRIINYLTFSLFLVGLMGISSCKKVEIKNLWDKGGKWNIEKTTYVLYVDNEEKQSSEIKGNGDYYQFNQNGTGYAYDKTDGRKTNFTYGVTDETLTLKVNYPYEFEQVYTIDKWNKKKITLKVDDYDEEDDMRYLSHMYLIKD